MIIKPREIWLQRISQHHGDGHTFKNVSLISKDFMVDPSTFKNISSQPRCVQIHFKMCFRWFFCVRTHFPTWQGVQVDEGKMFTCCPFCRSMIFLGEMHKFEKCSTQSSQYLYGRCCGNWDNFENIHVALSSWAFVLSKYKLSLTLFSSRRSLKFHSDKSMPKRAVGWI